MGSCFSVVYYGWGSWYSPGTSDRWRKGELSFKLFCSEGREPRLKNRLRLFWMITLYYSWRSVFLKIKYPVIPESFVTVLSGVILSSQYSRIFSGIKSRTLCGFNFLGQSHYTQSQQQLWKSNLHQCQPSKGKKVTVYLGLFHWRLWCLICACYGKN